MARVPFHGTTIPDGPFPTGVGPDAGDGLCEIDYQDATEAEDAIAREIAAGILPADVARARRIHTNKLTEILKAPHVQTRVAYYRDILTLRAQQLVAKTWLAATESLDEVIAIAKSRQHRRHYDANIYLLERVWPQTTHSQLDVNHNLSADVVMRLIDGIESIKSGNGKGTTEGHYRLEDDPHLQDGRDVAYGLTVTTPTPTVTPSSDDDSSH
jgi:hypothetical protein